MPLSFLIFYLGLRFFVNNEERLIKVTAGKRVDIYESCTCVFGRLLGLLWWTHVQALASLIWLTAVLLYPDSCLLFNLKECLRFLMTCGMRKVERDIKWHQILFDHILLISKDNCWYFKFNRAFFIALWTPQHETIKQNYVSAVTYYILKLY